MNPAISIEIRHAERLCYVMQQTAVPWLHGITLRNEGVEPLTDLRVVVELAPGLLHPHVELVAVVPTGSSIELQRLDPRLDIHMVANLLERLRAELRVTVHHGEHIVAVASADVEVLAYNEWPGTAVLPDLLAAFVSPNHPELAAVLRLVSARLQQATGNGALDGYQSKDPRRALAMFAAVHDDLAARGVTYINPPPSFERTGQKVRTPEQVLGAGLATCLDLVLLYAALLEHIGLKPLLVLQQDHAFVGVWLHGSSWPESAIGTAVELRKQCDLGGLAVVECTMACAHSAMPFAVASAAARRRLAADTAFVCAIDVAAARRAGIQPLPPRTAAFTPLSLPTTVGAVPPPRSSSETSEVESADEVPGARPPEPPKDRLEHWKSKLLDLSMWNRLLNFAETKKTVPLCNHDITALTARLQLGGRFRVHARPSLGQADKDPRDLDLAQQRTGVDVRAEYLAEELRAGRLRAELDAEPLDERLVEIFRHARTSIEESGANTLYLAIGFLQWYESPQAQKPRRAPLLLLPLTVERLSVQDGFRFVLDDAEPRLNQSLLQMLARDHELRVALGEAPPEDENGVDVIAVLDAFRAAVLAMPRWEVAATACIGFFSFTKYLMWLDLAERDELLKSPVLRHLVQTPGAVLAQDVPEMPGCALDDLDPSLVFCPKDADSSQLAAVLAGAAGRTFVLEGPPGTGKSQTITNLIAQALANGRRVLFVAEKRAALEVVQRRLDEVGLGPFCLELHSSKSGPKAVLEQLRRALDLGVRRLPDEWGRVATSLQQERQRLNAYVQALHRPREHGISVFAAMAQLVLLGDGGRVVLPGMQWSGVAPVAVALASVDDLASVATGLSVPSKEPWWGVRLCDWTPALGREVIPLAQRLAHAAAAMAGASAPVAAAFGLDRVFGSGGPSAAQLVMLRELASHFAAPSLPPSAMLRADWRVVTTEITEAVAIGSRRQAAWHGLVPRWRAGLLGLELDRLAAVHRAALPAFFLLRWWRLRGPRRELAAVAVDRRVDTAARVLEDLQVAIQVGADDLQLAAATTVPSLVGVAWQSERTDWPLVSSWLLWVEDVRSILARIVPGALQPEAPLLAAVAAQIDAVGNGATALQQQIGALRLAHDELASALRALGERLQLDALTAFGDEHIGGHLQTIEQRARTWLASVGRLRDQCAYERAAQAATAASVGPLVAAHARGELRTDELQSVFRRTFLEGWLDVVHGAEPELARFRGQEHESAIARFADLDRRSIRLAAEVVLARLAAQLPQVRDTQVASSELGILEREIKKQRRHKPVRRLFAEIPGLLVRLAPCVLMSPLSVAQFLGRAGTRFDLVVFDEASQIPMWDAVGAIGRGSSLVVVGDSRQLPPTTFFQRLAQGDEPAPDEVPEDLESVLDECGAAGLPRMFLDWHYRSRHESLIAFSNHHYYGNRLLTFPAPQQVAPGLGVRFVHVDGVYDRAGSQQNRREAEALVADVTAQLLDPARAKYSVGIVTFSQAQQVLIEDLLDRARAEHPEIEPWFTSVTEPVFIKNLENVQGDERDTILFSICYGPDAAGKIHENYGPLNQQGGERRLNVAVTRARRELVVFASVRADQVATRTPALGARHLRTFLDYAQRGQAALVAAVTVDPSRGVESPFEAAVRDALVRRGHEVHTQVGCSGYRIDLAVVDPDAAGRYLLGIECDGAAYHSAATARDRDRLRASVLQGLGWRLHRVWSTDFWQDPNGEMARAEAAIAAARAAVVANEPPSPPPSVPLSAPHATAPEPEQRPVLVPAASALSHDQDGPRRYEVTKLPVGGSPDGFAAASALRALRAQATQLLAVEGPVAFDRLTRMLATTWGVLRVTDRVRERVRAALPEGAVEEGGIAWASRDQAATFRGFRVPGGGDAAARDADELPGIEVENAMAWLLRQHQALADDDLAREAARCFGIQRLGTVVRDVMGQAVARLLVAGRGVRDGGLVRLP